ncbi:MAG: TSUP family transporter, partial [Bradyrhizobium sp.]
VLTIGAGAVLGGLVSLTSIGAGALGVVALTLLYPRLPTPRIVGADIVHAVPLTLVAGIGHWLTSTVDAGILASLLVGSLPGIVLGSYAAAYVSDRALRLTLATVLTIVGGKLVL